MKLTRRSTLALATGALAMPFVQRARAEDAVLNVYNWADYIGETTVADFEAASNIKVTYDTYSSTDEMQAKMLAGHSGYDVVTMSGLSLPRFVKSGIYDKLDKSKLPNWKNLDPEVLKIGQGFDPGSEYGLPYMWGSVGIAYNLDMVKQRLPNADLDSLDTLFKPENAAKLADCGISILDEPTDVIMLTLTYLGKDGNSQNPADYDAVKALFKGIRPDIRTFDSTNYLNAIPNKELCVINSWSGDYSTAKSRAADAGVKIDLGYYVPKTGAPAWIDMLCIPADAAHKENAYKFLDYLLQPEVIAKCTNFTNYANGNSASKAFVDPAILANPAVYPSEEVMKRLWTPTPLTDEQERLLTDTFTSIKSG